MRERSGQDSAQQGVKRELPGMGKGVALRAGGPHGRVYRFGAYELNLPRYQLLRAGKHLHLARAPMELLQLLVEARGALLTREAIAAHLWESPGLVDVDQGINTAIRRIREMLGDDPARPRYIETVVGRGYRFLAAVTVEDERAVSGAPTPRKLAHAMGTAEATENLTREAPEQSRESEGGGAPGEAAAVEVEAKVWSWRWTARWTAAAVGAGLIVGLPLTLPGGRAILRRALAGRAQVHAIAPPADAERELFRPISTNDGDMRVTAGAVSPDGRWVAYADRSGILLKVVKDSDTEPLRSPPGFRCDRIAWSPGQLAVLASGVAAGAEQEQVWEISITGGAPRLLLSDGHNGVPSPDGRQMLFTRGRDREIWTAAITGEGARHLAGDEGSTPVTAVFWSGDGRRLACLRSDGPEEGARYTTVDAATGKLLAESRLLSFSAATALRDGRLLLLGASRSTAGNAAALWEVQTDPATGAILSAPTETAPLEPGKAFALTASDDGRVLSVVLEKGQPDVYAGVLRKAGSELTSGRRLTFDTQADYPHSWLPDNATVVFESNRSGTFQIYRQRLQDATATELTNGTAPAVLPHVTGDGRWILYGAKPRIVPSAEDRLMRLSTGGGTPEQVPIGGPLDDFACALRAARCVLRVKQEGRAIVFYALDPVRGRGEELARLPWVPVEVGGWGVSPEGDSLALPASDALGIRVIALSGSSGDREHVVGVGGISHLTGVSWSADGQGWFGTERSATGSSLVYVNAHGRTRVLLETPLNTWGVPSPDGRRLAYVDQSNLDSNVWLLQRP